MFPVTLKILINTFWGKLPFTKKDDSSTIDSINSSPISDPSLPSTGNNSSDYPEGYLSYFSKKLGLVTEAVKERAKGLFSSSNSESSGGISSNVGIPRGLYRDGNQTMWKGLPIPRVENYQGTDYYINLDKDGFINMFDSKMDNYKISIINPIS